MLLLNSDLEYHKTVNGMLSLVWDGNSVLGTMTMNICGFVFNLTTDFV